MTRWLALSFLLLVGCPTHDLDSPSRGGGDTPTSSPTQTPTQTPEPTARFDAGDCIDTEVLVLDDGSKLGSWPQRILVVARNGYITTVGGEHRQILLFNEQYLYDKVSCVPVGKKEEIR